MRAKANLPSPLSRSNRNPGHEYEVVWIMGMSCIGLWQYGSVMMVNVIFL